MERYRGGRRVPRPMKYGDEAIQMAREAILSLLADRAATGQELSELGRQRCIPRMAIREARQALYREGTIMHIGPGVWMLTPHYRPERPRS